MRFVYTKNSEDFKSVNSKTKGEMLQNSTISLLLPSISNFFLTLAYSYLGFPSQGSWMYMVSSCISKVLWCYFLASQTVSQYKLINSIIIRYKTKFSNSLSKEKTCN